MNDTAVLGLAFLLEDLRPPFPDLSHWRTAPRSRAYGDVRDIGRAGGAGLFGFPGRILLHRVYIRAPDFWQLTHVEGIMRFGSDRTKRALLGEVVKHVSSHAWGHGTVWFTIQPVLASGSLWPHPAPYRE